MILDIHTHHCAPQPEGVVSADSVDFAPEAGQAYSVGLHPWRTDVDAAAIDSLRKAARHPEVVAIGECGLDTGRGAPLYSQILTLRACIEIARDSGKPMVIHDVKSHAQIIGMHRQMNPEGRWCIHGFRGKPGVAAMLLAEGFYLSYGERFNPESLKTTPADRLLAETDDSDLDIEQVIERIGAVRTDIGDIRSVLADNAARFLGIQNKL